MDFLLEHEQVFDQGHSAFLLNINEAGTIRLTNYRLLFVSKKTQRVVELGTIPLAAIEELNDVPSEDLKSSLPPEPSMLKVTGHDARVIVFLFESKNKVMKEIIGYLKKCIKPAHLGHIYAFSSKPPTDKISSSDVRLHKEYHRLFNKWFAQSPSSCFEAQVRLQNKWWRVSELNSDYQMCQSYPTRLIVPKTISDEDLLEAATHRMGGRVAAISWFDSGSGAVLARSSQPKIMCLTTKDELVCALRTPSIHEIDRERKLYIVDARSRLNANANMGRGGGTELSSIYTHTEVWFAEIDNIHAMATSFRGLREYVNTYGSISSDGAPLHPRDWISWQTLKNLAEASKLKTWLSHIENILFSAWFITTKITRESASVLVHCSDGWDRTSQLVGLSCLLLDPFYRTFSGFEALVEKDWLAFGHKFAARMGLPTMMAGEEQPEYKLPWLAEGSIQSGESSPIFLQWVECIAHLLDTYPCAFEFSSKFLVDFMDAVLSCRFGNFLCNSEKERKEAGVASCLCIWKYLADLRTSEHEHRNQRYDPEMHSGPIILNAKACAPELWSQFYSRWSCPLEPHGGVGASQELVKEKMAEPIRESGSLQADENQPVKGRPIRVLGSNVKKR